MTDFEKTVRKKLIDDEMKLSDLAKEMNISISYLFELLQGTRRSEKQIARIKEILKLGDEDEESTDS